MLPDLEGLIRLQRLDDFVAGARRSLAEHPDRLKALDDRLAGARHLVAAAREHGARHRSVPERSVRSRGALGPGRTRLDALGAYRCRSCPRQRRSP